MVQTSFFVVFFVALIKGRRYDRRFLDRTFVVHWGTEVSPRDVHLGFFL